MTATDLGITIPFDLPLVDHGPLFRRLVGAGYGGLWTAETARHDAFTPLALAAAITPDVVVGTAIASVFSRGPALLAMNAAALADAAPGRAVVGIGASSAVMTEDWNDGRFHRPLARVRDAARFLRAALAGERIDQQYDTFAVRRFRLERPPSAPPVILVAALREAMLAVGARDADGVVLNWLAAHDVRTVRQVIGPEPTVAARIFVCVGEDATGIRESARRLVATYATVPAYADFHRWLGRGDQLAETGRLWAAGDRPAAIAAVPDDVVDDLIVHGSAERCAELVARYAAAGVDRPVVKMLALDPSRDLIADAVALAAAYAARNGPPHG